MSDDYGDLFAELDALLARPLTEAEIPPEVLKAACEAVEHQRQYEAWYATLTDEEREAEDWRRIEAAVQWIMHGPGGP